MSAPRTPGGEGDQPPQPVMAAALAAQPAPAPAAAADAVERFRISLGECMQTEERIVVPDDFAIEGARVGLAKLARLAALPPGALDAVFSRTGVQITVSVTSSPYAPPPPGARAPQPAALPGAAPPALRTACRPRTMRRPWRRSAFGVPADYRQGRSQS